MYRHIGQVQDTAPLLPGLELEFEFEYLCPPSTHFDVYVEIYGHHKLHISLLLN